MNQSSQNTNPTKPEPSGSGTPDFMLGESTSQVGEASEPVGASTGSAGAATGQLCQTDEAATSNRYLYAPEQSSSRYDPYAAGQFPSQRWEDPNSDSVASWVGVVLLMVIPLVNLITVLVMAFSSSFSRAKQNFARAILLVIGILIGVMFLIGLTSGAMSWVVRR